MKNTLTAVQLSNWRRKTRDNEEVLICKIFVPIIDLLLGGKLGILLASEGGELLLKNSEPGPLNAELTVVLGHPEIKRFLVVCQD